MIFPHDHIMDSRPLELKYRPKWGFIEWCENYPGISLHYVAHDTAGIEVRGLSAEAEESWVRRWGPTIVLPQRSARFEISPFVYTISKMLVFSPENIMTPAPDGKHRFSDYFIEWLDDYPHVMLYYIISKDAMGIAVRVLDAEARFLWALRWGPSVDFSPDHEFYQIERPYSDYRDVLLPIDTGHW